MALATSGLLVLPAWANAWTRASVKTGQRYLSTGHSELLTEIIDTILPASDSLGAKALGVPDFVQKMVADCYEPPAQENFRNGLDAVDVVAKERFNQPFLGCDATQRTAVLQQLEMDPQADRKTFYSGLKNLTIQGFTTSEYVMTKYLHYNMIPGHYYGCVPAAIANK